MKLLNKNKSNLTLALASILSLSFTSVFADEYQDMSDPMAVYSQAGLGYYK